MTRNLTDGSKAIGLFNTGTEPVKITLEFSDIKVKGSQKIRNLWLHKDLGIYDTKFETMVEPHGTVLLKITSRGK